MNLRRNLRLSFCCMALFGCVIAADAENPSTVGIKPERMLKVTYRKENYKVPEGEIWKLTWESPYKASDIHPSYDVRVLGVCCTSQSLGTSVAAYSSKPGKSGLMDVVAGKTAAEIWIMGGVEFHLANDLVKVSVEACDENRLLISNMKVQDGTKK